MGGTKSGKPERKRQPRGDAPRPRSSRPPTGRAKQNTLSYEERPREPRPLRPPQTSSPEFITFEETPIGRATQHAIEQELATAGVVVDVSGATTEIFEISTFVITGDEIFGKASDASRRDFVQRRLLHRLPVLSMNDVIRIDLSRSPAAKTVILRIWTKVSRPSS